MSSNLIGAASLRDQHADSTSWKTWNFRPTDIFGPTKAIIEKSCKVALIFLNGARRCHCISNHVDRFWDKSVVQICADGSANRLYDINPKYIPSVICGDLDSCDASVAEYYKQKGTEICHYVDDDSTDFTKCITLLKKRGYLIDDKIDSVVVLGGLCGRFDHVLGCLQTLCLAKLKLNIEKVVYIVHNESLAFLLPKGHSVVHVDLRFVTGKCGFVPLGPLAKSVTTAGFEWNLKNQEMIFGGCISTSNEIRSERVEISTDSPLLFTIEVDSALLKES